MTKEIEYDVALTFAGPDRKYAEKLAHHLSEAGVRVFYDKFETERLWGEDLYTYLADIYSKRARYCVMFLSKHYAELLWTNHERRFAQARAFRENSAYILPLKIDDTEIPGVADTIGYVNLLTTPIEEVAGLVLRKLNLDQTIGDKRQDWEDAVTTFAREMIAQQKQDLGVANYVPLRYENRSGHNGNTEEALNTWLSQPSDPVMLILGDYGTGKTTFCRWLTLQVSENIVNKHDIPLIPVFAPLREVAQFLTAADPIVPILDYCAIPRVSEQQVRYLIIFDGYDELLDKNQRSSFHSLLRRLIRRPSAKIPNYCTLPFFQI